MTLPITNDVSDKRLVIYHADCIDGFGAAWCAWKMFGEAAQYLPANYPDPVPWDQIDAATTVYILDFCYGLDDMQQIVAQAGKLVWIDHHKGQQHVVDALTGKPTVSIHYKECHSGAVLAFQYFWPNLPSALIPRVLYCIEDFDLWRFAMPETRSVCAALESYPKEFEVWEDLISGGVANLVVEGRVIARHNRIQVSQAVKEAIPVRLNGIVGLALNATRNFASDAGHTMAILSGTFGLVWHQLGNGKYKCSLRSIGEFDVDILAKQYGGGGHKNSAAFVVEHPVW